LGSLVNRAGGAREPAPILLNPLQTGATKPRPLSATGASLCIWPEDSGLMMSGSPDDNLLKLSINGQESP